MAKSEEKSADRRVLKTKRAIRDALISILEEKEIESITIKEISERAGINRKTFYAHYSSPADLISELEDEIVEAVHYLIRTDVPAEEGLGISSFVQSINAVYESNPIFFENLMTVRNYAFLAEKLTASLKNEIIKIPAVARLDPLLASFTIEFFAGGMTNVYVNWIRTGKTIPFEVVTRLALALTTRGLLNILPQEEGAK